MNMIERFFYYEQLNEDTLKVERGEPRYEAFITAGIVIAIILIWL